MSDFNEQFIELKHKITLQDFKPKNTYLYLKHNGFNFYIIETLYFIFDNNHKILKAEYCNTIEEILENINKFAC